MKKTILFALVILLAATSVFAGDFAIGVSAGFKQDILIGEHDNLMFNTIPINATMIADVSDNFALGFDLGMGINLKGDDSIVLLQNETKVGLVADVLAYYIIPMSKKADLYLGGGLGYDYVVTNTVKGINRTSDTSVHTLDVLVGAKGVFDVSKNVSLFGDAKFGIDVLKSLANNTLDSSTNLLENVFGIQWGLSLGAAYKF